MSNTFFRFKQFTINQDRCAMKVGTDGVLLGAWVNLGDVYRILDVGTGSGLIALMLAQRSEKAVIDAIEIDDEAAAQALENINATQWKGRISVIHTSFQEFVNDGRKYDLVVSNPPFFMNLLQAPEPKRNIARHGQKLSYSELLVAMKNLLLPEGRLGIILPAGALSVLIKTAETYDLFPERMTLVKSVPEKNANRILAEFSYSKKETQIAEITIEKYGRHNYSEEYIALTKAFYISM
jgi:tRNA1Val (adenine37-N6)-methyltransferase